MVVVVVVVVVVVQVVVSRIIIIIIVIIGACAARAACAGACTGAGAGAETWRACTTTARFASGSSRSAPRRGLINWCSCGSGGSSGSIPRTTRTSPLWTTNAWL